MYLPEAFRLDDRDAILAYAATYPFATVVTCGANVSQGVAAGTEGPVVSHLPLLVDPARSLLRGHIARDNVQFLHLAAGAEVTAIFHGPHGYVSPSAYVDTAGAVPTWDYVVVHARGRARVVGEQTLLEILDEMVARFDTTGWRAGAEEHPRLAAMRAAIAGFEVEITALEGKCKLSQNRSSADQARVVTWLEQGDDQGRALAALMRARLEKLPSTMG